MVAMDIVVVIVVIDRIFVVVMVVMVIMVIMVFMVIMIIRTDRKTRTTGRTGQRDLTFKLEFPGNLCRAAFAILALFLLFLYLAASKAFPK